MLISGEKFDPQTPKQIRVQLKLNHHALKIHGFKSRMKFDKRQIIGRKTDDGRQKKNI